MSDREEAAADDPLAALESFRLADSFLPVGGYTLSYGLEQFVADDRVTGADDLRDLLATYLRNQLGPAELVALRAAHAAAGDGDVDAVCDADRRLTAVTLPAEFRESSRKSGRRLLSLQRELRDDPVLDGYAERVEEGDTACNYAVVLGAATGVAGVDADRACLLCCHGFVTGRLGVAQRLLSLGHTDAQRVLDDLRPVMVEAADDSVGRGLADMTPFSPLVDVLSAEHERADRRLFVS
ncbi:urease accessory protein UreF [Candidatus Halobonum tyrrellensis]|uniref:Urease accessory protein F UreF n=1 Tax=Candidatus Halobonum tyrrellensis G22 TaxID=1324957 RepID=V4GY35_9EURY|nr:urease accessory UreF family protein [Candidatus Halobonum tyrrellensis]ESP90091.1 urease accessory protein F UreF [Candidatus Halobonum tyrrellensis G22]